MSTPKLTSTQWEIHYRLQNDPEFFALMVQKIEPKDLTTLDEDVPAKLDALFGEHSIAGMIPLIYHPGQKKFNAAANEMKKRLGYVRKVMVKPRQVGWSTVIHARFHWLACKTAGMRFQIVSHTSDSTRDFLRRFKKMCLAAPDTVTPGRSVDNSKEIVFNNGASVRISTAGSPDAIRGGSFQGGHASEEPSYDDPIGVMASFLPALSDGPGSEGYRESTSKGKGTPWHQFVMASNAGETGWELFFDGWQNHPKYQRPAPMDWQPDEEAKHTQVLYNLSREQLYWRHLKIKELRALWLFKQEFPATVEESFQAAEDTLYNPDAVTRALSNWGQILPDPFAPLILGVDPARKGGDRTVLVFRQGNVIVYVKIYEYMDDMRLAGIIAEHLKSGISVFGRTTKVAKCFMDYAIGEGVASRLRELGFGKEVMVVGFGDKPNEDRYLNKRAEMGIEGLGNWLGDTGEHVAIYNPPNDPIGVQIASDFLAIPGFLQTIGSDRIKLAPKDDIRKQVGFSPDIFDAAILTYAFPVQAEKIADLQQHYRTYLSESKPNEMMQVLMDFGDN